MSDNQLLREFIERQLQERSMSAREFARFVGVASSTISRAMSYDKSSDPSIEFLMKLSRATATDICEIIYLIYPDTRPNRRPEVTRLADEIATLPPNMQELIDSLIVGMVIKQGSNQGNKG